MPAADTKSRLLDTAEMLFARDGFHSTSLRAITRAAEVNLAAVNYHFGSKEALLHAVVERRLLPLNQARNKQLRSVLEQAEGESRYPLVRPLLKAFIEPTLALRNAGPGAEHFITLIGRSISEPDPTVRNCFVYQVLPSFKLLFTGLRQALPNLPVPVLLSRLQFTMGAMSHAMCSPLEQLPGFPQPLSGEAQMVELVNFVSYALERPL